MQANVESMQAMKTDIGDMKFGMQEMRVDIEAVKSSMWEMRTDTEGMKAGMQDMKSGMEIMTSKMREVQSEVQKLQIDVGELKDRVINIEMTVENEIRVNIQRVAEGHLDLSRNLIECIGLSTEVKKRQEMQDIYINMHENKLKALA